MIDSAWASFANTLLKIADKFGGLYAAFRAGQKDIKNDYEESIKDAAINDAHTWANADLTPTPDKLRRAAENKRKDAP